MTTAEIQKIDDCNLELQKISDWISANHFNSLSKCLNEYGVILACGSIEFIMKDIFYEKLSDGVKDEVKAIIKTQTKDNHSNPNLDYLGTLLKLKQKWLTDYKTDSKSFERNKKDLGSLCSLRNAIAHGNPMTTNITQIIDYYNSSIKLLELVDEILQRPDS